MVQAAGSDSKALHNPKYPNPKARRRTVSAGLECCLSVWASETVHLVGHATAAAKISMLPRLGP